MQVRFWGVRGSIATPGPSTLKFGGNTSCVEVRAGGRIIILDAGTGLRLLGKELADEFRDEPLDLVLLLTHAHWDHIQGLPFFAPVYNPQNHVRVVGYEGARYGLQSVLNGQMEHPFFPIGLPANVSIEETSEWSFQIGPVQVNATPANHPGLCVGYRVSAAGRSLAFFPDNELPAASQGPVQNGPNGRLVDFVRGVDVLIMDTQYTRNEYEEHIGWGHGCMEEVVELALAAGVKQLFLFHHDPEHDDQKISEMVTSARALVAGKQGELRVDAAREGLMVELPPVNDAADGT
jgi:phosphoribosyl 1,2-cyclic phosphodiesterase